MKSLRLLNESEKPLSVCIEPRGVHYDVAPKALVVVSGFDPAEEVLDAVVHVDLEGATVTFRSSNDISFLVAEHVAPLRHGFRSRIVEYLRPTSETSRTTTLRIENKTVGTLGLWVEPNPDYYHLAAGKIAELRGFDPKRDHEWDFYLNVRADETFVLVGPFGDVTAFVAGQRLPNVPL